MPSDTADRMTCKRPDRDQPNMICGYPIPCPYHTATIEITDDRIKVEVPRAAAPRDLLKTTTRLMDIGRAIRDGT